LSAARFARKEGGLSASRLDLSLSEDSPGVL
jgi:hypothetical protein